jgi:uncharacterized protein (DUF433 family)
LTDELLALTETQASHLARVSLRQLRYWVENVGLVRPTVVRQLSARNTVRLWGFQDLEALMVVAELRRKKMTPSHVARVVERLRREYQRPLNEIVFAVEGKEIYFQRPDGTWSGDRAPDQVVIREVLDLEVIRSAIRRAATAGRDRSEQGRVERRRKVLGHKPVFAGTRIPVASVLEYIEEGCDDETILAAFPRLTVADIQSVREKPAIAR